MGKDGQRQSGEKARSSGRQGAIGTSGNTRGAGPIFVCDASAEAERLITTLRNRGYLTVDVPLGMLPSRVRYEEPDLVVCDADAHEALRRIREMREATTASIQLLFVGHDDGALRRESEFREIATATLTRPLNLNATVELIGGIVGPPPESPRRRPRPSRRGSRAPVLVASARKPYRSDTSAPPPSSSRNEGDEIQWPLSSSPQLGPLLGESSMPPSEPGSSPGMTLPPSSAPPKGASGALSPETRALLEEGRRRVAAHPPQPTRPNRSGDRQESAGHVAPELLEALKLPLDAEDSFEAPWRPSQSSPRLSRQQATHATDAAAPELTTHGGARTRNGFDERERPTTRGVPSAPPPGEGEHEGDARVAPWQSGAERDSANLAWESEEPSTVAGGERRGQARTGDEHSGETGDVGASKATRDGTSTGAPGSAWTGPSEGLDQQTNPGGRPPSQPADEGPDSREPLRRSIGAIAARPLMSTPPPLDDLSDLLAPGSSRRPPSMPLVAPTPPPTGELLNERTDRPRDRYDDLPPSQPSLLPEDLGSSDEDWTPRRTVAALGLCIRQRRSGSLAQQVDGGVRRITLRDGDILTVTSSRETETLAHFLVERGDLSQDVFDSLGPIPRFGRHAGAALVARGHLRQEDLWPVLRAHAEWILGRMMLSEETLHLEGTVPARISEEPAVFGGAAGAEVYLDVLQRVLDPRAAFVALGSGELKLGLGSNQALLGEAALPRELEDRAMAAVSSNLQRVLTADPDVVVTLLGLVELGVVSVGGGTRPAPPPRNLAAESAQMDAEAFAARVRTRRSLVDEGDYFTILGVTRSATSYEIDRAHEELHRELSPERLDARSAHLKDDILEVLAIVDEAHLVLRDDVRRERYRKALQDPPERPTGT